MINSPSISPVSTPPKPDKASSAQSAAASGDRFGDVFNNTAEASSASATPNSERHEKPAESGVNQKASNASENEGRVGDASDKAAAESQNSPDAEANGSDNSEAHGAEEKAADSDGSNKTSGEKESDPDSKDGNLLHNDGQNIAGDEGASSDLPEEASGNLTLESDSQNVVNKEGKQGLNDTEGELDLELLSKEQKANGDVAAEDALTQDGIEPSDGSEELDAVQADGSVLSQQPKEAAQASAQVADSDGSPKPLDEQPASLQPSSASMSAAQVASVVAKDGAAEQTALPVAEKAADTVNLKWVMDQLSATKLERSGAAGNVLHGQAEPSSDLKLTDMVNMDEWLESGDIDLSKSFEEVMSAKKPLDQLMANIASQSQSLGAQSLTSSTTMSSFASARGDVPAQLTMQAPPTSPQWAEEMHQKVNWVVREGIKTAHIQLDPPELGSLVVKVTMDQDSNTQISFVASSAQAKEALEGQMQRLREMLQQQGLDLDAVDVEVSQRNDQSGQSGSFGEEGGEEAPSGTFGSLEGDADEELENLSYVTPAARGIDYYA